MSMIDFFKTGEPGRVKQTTYTVVSTTISSTEVAGQTVLSVTSSTGMSSSSGKNGIRISLDDFTFHQSTITNINAGAGTITIANALPSQASAGNSVVATGVYSFTLPSQAIRSGVLYATYCGGGQGGAGGHATGGGGGGGGASATFRDMPVYVSTAGTIAITVGHGGAGGAIGANGLAGAITKIEDGSSQITYPLPTGRPANNAASLAVAGGAASGGKGGDGGPLITLPLIAATSTAGVEGGPLGGAGGVTTTNGGAGQAAFRRGYAGTTGAAGGGGGSTLSKGGAGGADEKHGDQSDNGVASGGAGGGSFLGGAAYGGDPAVDPFGRSANGPGAGGGGGGTAGGGGNGGEGIVILRWM